MKKIFPILLVMLVWMQVSAQNVTSVTYSPLNENIANPERGFYHYELAKASTFTPLSYNSLLAMRNNEKITLVWRCYQLDSFITSNISANFLQKIQVDFNTLRAAGMKCVLRFSYREENGTPWEPTKSQILTHISQLKSVISTNQDVISSIEAGFIGKYGEWYQTTYFGTENLTPQNYADRLEVALQIMELAPERMVSFRYPYAIRRLFGATPISVANAYDGSNNSRAASHNDCFLGNATDYGTYQTPLDYTYLEQQTRYTFNGGETCNCSLSCSNSDPYINTANALTNLQRFHFNYLNIEYNEGVLDHWNNTGFLETVKRRLGYRYELGSSSIENNVLTINLTNTGFATLFNRREVFLVLRNNIGGAEYSFLLDTDPRCWPIGTPVQITQNLSLDVPSGNYRLFLNFPEKPIEALIERLIPPVEYSIRCANVGTWENTTGYNDLLLDTNIRNLGLSVFVKDGRIVVFGADRYSILIYDVSGKHVGSDADISGLAEGMYFAKVNDQTFKIIK